MLKEYIMQNWATILVIIAFAILLKTTVFLEKKIINRMYFLIFTIFVLSIIVFIEFYYNDLNKYRELRTVLMSIRYSTTPFIIAMIIFTLVKKARWYVFIPVITLAVINIISIFTGIVFSVSEENVLIRGPLGYLPYIAVGAYSVFLVYILLKQSNKQATEVIPIIFLCFAFASGLILPFILGKNYSKIFCSTIIIALFVYYVFSILQLTKKDSLTGLFNRQAYYATIQNNSKDITGVISIDMNGLKTINDTYGHAIGDKALVSIALCFTSAVKSKQLIYRVGGDEFIIICYKTTEEEIKELILKIENNLIEENYSCALGYSYAPNRAKSIDDMVKKSDDMMYSNKAKYYSSSNMDRRKE